MATKAKTEETPAAGGEQTTPAEGGEASGAAGGEVAGEAAGEAAGDAAGDGEEAGAAAASDGDGEAAAAGEAGDGDGEGEAGEGEGGDPSAEPKSKTAKERRAELSKDPEVKRLLKNAADAAVRAAMKAEAEKQQKEAERAKMEVADRLKAEKSDLAKERDEALEKQADAEFQLTFYRQLVSSGKTLVDADAIEFVRMKVAKKLEDGADMADAVDGVLSENPYLVQTETTPPKQAPARTQPPTKKTTGKPAAKTPSDPVDVSKMTRQQFREHMRAQHGVESP